MSPSQKINIFSPNPLFRGIFQWWKIVLMSPLNLLTFLMSQSMVMKNLSHPNLSHPSQSHLSHPILPLNPCYPLLSLVPASITRNFPQVPKVYLWEKAIPEQKQVLESNSDPGNEITVRSDPPLHTQPGETSMDLIDNLDLDLPIVVRKGTRECTNWPLYPLSRYVFLKHLSPTHKNFIMSLNTTIIPNTVSEALTKRE